MSAEIFGSIHGSLVESPLASLDGSVAWEAIHGAIVNLFGGSVGQ